MVIVKIRFDYPVKHLKYSDVAGFCLTPNVNFLNIFILIVFNLSKQTLNKKQS